MCCMTLKIIGGQDFDVINFKIQIILNSLFKDNCLFKIIKHMTIGENEIFTYCKNGLIWG